MIKIEETIQAMVDEELVEITIIVYNKRKMSWWDKVASFFNFCS